MAGVQQVSFTSPYAAEEEEIARRKRMAELLQAQAAQPLDATRSAGGWAVPISPWEGVAKVAQGAAGGIQAARANEAARALRERQQGDTQADMRLMIEALRGRPAQAPDDEERMLGIGPGSPGAPAVPAGQIDPSLIGQLRTPGMQQAALGQFMAQMQPKKPLVVGRSLLDETGRVLGQDATWQAEQEAARKAREAEAEARRTEAQRAEAARIEEARRAEQARFDQQRSMAGIAAGLRQPPQAQIIQTAQGPMVVGPNNVLSPLRDAQGNQAKPAAGRGGPMTATAQKELIETEEQMQGGQAALDLFKQAKAINDKAMGFAGAGIVSSAGTILPDFMRPETVDATQNLDNILQTAALPQLKAIFGGMPTEGERKILLDVQGSSSKPAKVRAQIFERAEKAIQARIKFAAEKAKRLREGTYFSGDGLPSIGGGEGGATGGWKDI